MVTQGTAVRSVYLPEGVWYDYWTKERFKGPTWILKEAPLETCPIYIKAGSIIPTMEPVSYVGEKPLDKPVLEVWPGKGSYDHFLDNGEDFQCRDGAYHHYHFTVDGAGEVHGSIVHAGYEKPYCRICTINTVEDARANGDENIWFIDGARFGEQFGAGDSITVDGCHPNDLGFMCMANVIGEKLKEVRNERW